MSLRDIVLMGDPVLRARAAPVEAFDDELRALVDDMLETMYHADGIGLAAPQVGISKRVLVVDVRDREDDGKGGKVALVNPEVVVVADETDRASEGCLSIPGLEEIVERPRSAEIRGFDPEGHPVSLEAEGLYARALLHEIDHLDGILFVDRVSPLQRKILLKKWQKRLAEAKAG